LHCQSHTTLEKDKELITTTVSLMKRSFENFNKENLVFDVENDLKDYLDGYSKTFSIILFLRDEIKTQLIPFIA
jgi:hypothetical protein